MFVPVVHHHEQEQPLTPRGRDLGERLATSIREFQRQYPGTSDDDLRGALRHAGRMTGLRPRGKDRQAAAVIAALVAAFVGVGLFTRQSATGGDPATTPVIGIAVVLGLVGAILGIFIARRRSS